MELLGVNCIFTGPLRRMIRLRTLLPIIAWLLAVSTSWALQDTFDMLEVDSEVYSNVVVTSRTSTHVYITHSFGMTGLQVNSLEPALLKQLGYDLDKLQASSRKFGFANPIFLPAKAREVKRDFQAIVGDANQPGVPGFLMSLVLFGVVLHLFLAYCFQRICLQAGTSPGLIVWIPALQIIPLLRAAKMSPWWWLLGLIPVANLLVMAVWSFKLCEVLKKSKWIALWLFLPVTSFFTVIYLAFWYDANSRDAAQPATPFVYQR